MTPRYTGPAIVLHWLMALLTLGLIPLGLYMADLPLSPQKLKLYSYHKWAGITVLALFVPRLCWRITHPAPPLPQDMSATQAKMAHTGHIALYVLMLAAPLSGWLMSSAHGFQTVWFGVWPLPDLIGKDPELAATLKLVHRFLNYALMVVVVGHILAALQHHFIHRNGLLLRMQPQHSRKTHA